MKKIYMSGCYGTNNLGDEAIFQGAKNYFGSDFEVIQIYHRIPSAEPSVWIHNILEYGFPQDVTSEDELIIGGGGLFYEAYIVGIWNLVVDQAKKVGMRTSIQGVGLEYCQSAYFIQVRELFNKVDFISVRSYESKRILEEDIGGIQNITIAKDFVYSASSASKEAFSFSNCVSSFSFTSETSSS